MSAASAREYKTPDLGRILIDRLNSTPRPHSDTPPVYSLPRTVNSLLVAQDPFAAVPS